MTLKNGKVHPFMESTSDVFGRHQRIYYIVLHIYVNASAHFVLFHSFNFSNVQHKEYLLTFIIVLCCIIMFREHDQ